MCVNKNETTTGFSNKKKDGLRGLGVTPDLTAIATNPGAGTPWGNAIDIKRSQVNVDYIKKTFASHPFSCTPEDVCKNLRRTDSENTFVDRKQHTTRQQIGRDIRAADQQVRAFADAAGTPPAASDNRCSIYTQVNNHFASYRTAVLGAFGACSSNLHELVG